MVFQLGSDLNADDLQFTLTCISTGGPATTVIWTRDSQTVSGGMTVFNNAIAQYTHTLTVTGRLGGQYQCNVTNNKPSISVAQLKLQGIVEVYFISYSMQYCYCFAIYITFQLPQLPLASLQSEKIALIFESLGPHPLPWGIQLGTGSTIVVVAVAVRMSAVVPRKTTY